MNYDIEAMANKITVTSSFAPVVDIAIGLLDFLPPNDPEDDDNDWDYNEDYEDDWDDEDYEVEWDEGITYGSDDY